MSDYFVAVSAEFQKKERAKARELRASQWWRQKLGERLCHYCGQRFEKVELTMDHLVPIARGGRTTKSNVVVACKTCNSEKKYHTPAELRLMELAASGKKL